MSGKTVWIVIGVALGLPLLLVLGYVNIGSGSRAAAGSQIFPKRGDAGAGRISLNEPPKTSMLIPAMSTPAASSLGLLNTGAAAQPAAQPKPPTPPPPPRQQPAAPPPAPIRAAAQYSPPPVQEQAPRPRLKPFGKTNFMNVTFHSNPSGGSSGFGGGLGQGMSRPAGGGFGQTMAPHSNLGGAAGAPGLGAQVPARGGAPAVPGAAIDPGAARNIAIPNEILQKMQSAGVPPQAVSKVQNTVNNMADQSQMAAPKQPSNVQIPGGAGGDLQMNSIQGNSVPGGGPLNGGGPINSGQ